LNRRHEDFEGTGRVPHEAMRRRMAEFVDALPAVND
jgi:hypothetical protein